MFCFVVVVAVLSLCVFAGLGGGSFCFCFCSEVLVVFISVTSGTPVTTLPGAWCYRASAGTGWPSVSILSLGETKFGLQLLSQCGSSYN